MAGSATSICNLALAEIPHAPIQDINDTTSKAAAECRRVYRQALGELLEASRWTFATRRAALIPTSNPLEQSWAYAYALPLGMAVLHAVFAGAPASGAGAFAPAVGQAAAALSGQDYGGGRPGLGAGLGAGASFAGRDAAFAYERDEDRLYTDAPFAVAEYTAADPAEATFPPLFVRALAYDMAARLCAPLTGDASRKSQLVTLAEQARGRAMAADLNRRPTVIDPAPEALAVR